MSKKTTVIKFSLRVALGLSALLLSMGYSGPALASCEAFPKNPLWKMLTHDFARQHVDEKYDGDWQAYINNLEHFRFILTHNRLQQRSFCILL
ncbi:MAG: hypothetical protein O3A85_13820, partial [Proteobacteria bacterium]|nr:hypothetical protein [Pseudomonadota bacterium]